MEGLSGPPNPLGPSQQVEGDGAEGTRPSGGIGNVMNWLEIESVHVGLIDIVEV